MINYIQLAKANEVIIRQLHNINGIKAVYLNRYG